jgi:hypothetical protein
MTPPPHSHSALTGWVPQPGRAGALRQETFDVPVQDPLGILRSHLERPVENAKQIGKFPHPQVDTRITPHPIEIQRQRRGALRAEPQDTVSRQAHVAHFRAVVHRRGDAGPSAVHGARRRHQASRSGGESLDGQPLASNRIRSPIRHRLRRVRARQQPL